MKLLKVIWKDAVGWQEWTFKKEVLKKARRSQKFTSIGYLLFDEEDMVVLAGSIRKEGKNPTLGSIQVIPKGMIIKVTEITE